MKVPEKHRVKGGETMISRLEPNFQFEDCQGTLVERKSGVGKGTKMKVYIPTVIPRVTPHNLISKRSEKVNSVRQIVISENPPVAATSVTNINYISLPVADDIRLEQANMELYKKYLRELPYPTPIYYIPFTMTLERGRKVTISFSNSDLRGAVINL